MSITSDILRGHTETIILASLLSHDSYGYQINKDIMKKTGNAYELKEATLYTAFRRLEQAGYIRREPSPTDRRVQQLYLTEKAEALLPRILDVFSRWEEVLTRGFSEEEKAQARDLLSRMYLNAEAEVQQQSSPLTQPEYTNEPAEKRDGQ